MKLLEKTLKYLSSLRTAESISGFIATLSSFVLIFVGYGSQIMIDYKLKKVDGLSPALFVLSAVVFLSWMNYGFCKKRRDYFIIITNILNLIAAMIIIFQIIIYS
jgi:uncharacterized protein with PQ loop repeat